MARTPWRQAATWALRLWMAAAAGSGSVDALKCEGACLDAGVTPLMATRLMGKVSHLESKLAARTEQDVARVAGKGQVQPCVNGLSSGFFPCHGVDLLSQTTLEEMGVGSLGNDVWGWEDPLTKREYALYGAMNGLSIVDVTDPVNPVPLVMVPNEDAEDQSFWRDIKVFNNTAYIVADSTRNHLQVYDLERLREFVNVTMPTQPRVEEPDFVYTNFNTAHNLFINEASGYAMVVGSDSCSKGIHLVNLNDNRLEPEFAGCWGDDGYVHDLQCVLYAGPDTSLVGQEICFCYNEDTLTIVDITNKTVVDGELIGAVMLSRETYPGAYYTHQGWITEDSKFLLLNDETDEVKGATFGARTHLWDIANLTAVEYIGFSDSPVKAIDHNLYILGNYSFMANYASGLRVNNIAPLYDGGKLEEIAFFDTYPETDATGDGLWSSYIYLPSGNILLSSMEYGLLVVSLDMSEIGEALTAEPSFDTSVPEVDNVDKSLLPPGALFALGFAGVGAVSVIAVLSMKGSSRNKEEVPEDEVAPWRNSASV
mmetsp:Transcript_17843/g.32937  ORF Transcript_17843/g.32937 Transcript_17843/m.32937 type:complete len:540 (-) Transcript_17843:111-1730(-)